MMQAMYAQFAAEQGHPRPTRRRFSRCCKYQKEIDRLERAYNRALQHAVEHAEQGEVRADAADFSRRSPRASSTSTTSRTATSRAGCATVMSPLETQVREHHLQLRRRLESVKRIHSASGELEERIGELEQQDEALAAQIDALVQGRVARSTGSPEARRRAADRGEPRSRQPRCGFAA